MLKLGGIGTILIVALLIWTLSGSTPAQKLERGCRPVMWIGNVATSLAALTSDRWGEKTNSAFLSADYGCRYTLWRLFYEDEYQQAIKDGLIDRDTGMPTEKGRRQFN